jgi:hypothetical protein
MPFDKPWHRVDACGTRPRSSINAPKAGDELQVFQRIELVVDHRLVRHPGHDALGRYRILERVDAADRDRAGVRLQQSGNHAQGGRLAGAVGAEQGIKLALLDGERQAIDGRFGEGLFQAFDRKR